MTAAVAPDVAPVVEAHLHLVNPNRPLYEPHLRENTRWKDHVLNAHNDGVGKRVVICGAGPSLATDIGLLSTRPYDELWGCNRALPWLFHNGWKPTHAVWVDPGDAWTYEWADTYDVTYYVSTCCQPKLLEHLEARGCRFGLFHNWVGIAKPSDDWKCPLPQHAEWEYETYLYGTLYPATVCTGAGLNAVNRALALALYRGFSTITLIGTDCACITGATSMPPEGPDSEPYKAWLKEQIMYPPGNIPSMSATTVYDTYGHDAALLEGVIDGRRWTTRPDMIISAINLVRLKQEHGSRIELVGDTLPNAILGKSEEFMKALPQLNENSALINLASRGDDVSPV